MWWGCGTMPEYLISYFEMHLKDQYGAAAEIMRIGAHSAAFAIGLGLFMLLCYNEAVRHFDLLTDRFLVIFSRIMSLITPQWKTS